MSNAKTRAPMRGACVPEAIGALRMYQDGASVPSLAAHYGKSTKTIERWLAAALVRANVAAEKTVAA